jgi:hypothetical protein
LLYQNMMKWVIILFLDFFTIYSEVQILVIWNNHEFGVSMNCNVKCVENQGKNSECMHVKCKCVVTITWNNYARIKFHFYQYLWEMDWNVLEALAFRFPKLALWPWLSQVLQSQHNSTSFCASPLHKSSECTSMKC